MTEKPLKAYAVLDHDERCGDIYFARHSIVARKTGANEYGDGELTNVECRRAPWADKYAPGPVPWSARIENGWWIECTGCGQKISDDEYDDNDEPINFKIVEVGAHVFCSSGCRETHQIEKAEEARIKAAVVGDLTVKVMRTMPGAVIGGRHHVYVRSGPWPRAVQQGMVQFTFPGGVYGFACLRFDRAGEKPHFTIPHGDLPAFHRWRDAGYPPHMMDAQEVA